MTTAPRRPILDALLKLLRKLFYPEWLHEPQKRTRSSPSPVLPNLPKPVSKAAQKIHASTNGDLPRKAAPNGTRPQPPAPNDNALTVLGSDFETGEAVSLSLK